MTDASTHRFAPPAGFTNAPMTGAARKTVDVAAVAAFVMAVTSFVIWVIPAIVAIALASGAKANVKASNDTRSGRGLAIAAQVLSVVTLSTTVIAATLLLLV